MKKALIIITTILTTLTVRAQPPSLYELSHSESPLEGGKGGETVLFIFKTEQQAKTWTTIVGFTFIGGGAALAGDAERRRMYNGTSSDWDTFHMERDAGIILTGIGSASIGASIVIGQKINPWEIAWKLPAGALIYRGIAQFTYNATKP